MGSTLETDLYQLTMAAGYFHRGLARHRATCEMFVRRLPQHRSYLLFMGLERALDYLEELRFDEKQIEYLASLPALKDAMTPDFRAYLRALRFTGDVDAVLEGSVVFATEPLVRVHAPIVEAQLLETFLLSAVNSATAVATKAARIVQAAKGAAVIEFGARRTHPDAAVDAARAAYCAGCVGTSSVEAGMRFGIPVMGTAAHMWTMAHASEEEAFANYVATFPNASILLIDTYDTVRGAARAAKAAKEKLRGVRLDSGDLDALARAVRKVLDENGCAKAKIVASGDLNEEKIAALVAKGAPIDQYGVGTDLVTSLDAPSLGGVYKLVAIERDGEATPIAKFSEGKGTLPGAHQVFRTFDERGVIARDLIALVDERQRGEPLLVPILRGGKRVRPKEELAAIRTRAKEQMGALAPEFHALDGSPPRPPVEISPAAEALREEVRRRFVLAARAEGGGI